MSSDTIRVTVMLTVSRVHAETLSGEVSDGDVVRELVAGLVGHPVELPEEDSDGVPSDAHSAEYAVTHAVQMFM
jgi:hypothetical protein